MINFSRYQTILGMFFLLFLMTESTIQAQDDTDVYLRIYGTVVNSDNNANLSNCIVKVYKNEEFLEEYTTRGAGKYEFFLPTGYNYRFYYNKDGFVGKNIEIDCVDAAAMDDQFIFSLKADISLFNAIEGIDYSVMENPIGKGVCNGKKGKVQFDKNHTKNMELQIASIYVPVEANTSLANRVTIEEVITDVPDEDDEMTVENIFVEAENEQLAYEEVKEAVKIEEVTFQIPEEMVTETKAEVIENSETEEESIKEPAIEVVEEVAVEIIEEEVVEIIEKEAIEVTEEKTVEIIEEEAIEVKEVTSNKLMDSEQTSEDDNTYIWRVQIGAFANVSLASYTGLSNVDTVEGTDGITRILAGHFDTALQAAAHKIKLVNSGYSDAFLTAYRGDTIIPINETGVNLKNISYTNLREQIDE